tara:strand:+ start:726 stop:1328 length:603 start_codon:yes stop_codon:yes gene_type:complete
MTQPSAKRGPVSPGSFERFGNSAQGISATLKSIQQSARGVAEWIDGEATGTGATPIYAHDHRGGIWGRPLGVGYSVPVRPTGEPTRYELETFFNVPDPRPITGETLEDATLNGGYTYADVKAFTDGQIGPFTLFATLSVWEDQQWQDLNAVFLSFGAPGGGQVWSTATAGLHLPPGLVRLNVRGSSITNWQWLALVVPQR